MSFYRHKYRHKTDCMGLANPVFQAAESLAPDGHRGKVILSKIINAGMSNQVVPAPFAAGFLKGTSWMCKFSIP
jgi:hypothetical protein